MNCIKCSSELKEGAKFCGKCGTPQTAPAPSAPQPVMPQAPVQASTPAKEEDAIGTVKSKLFWNIQPGEIARRFTEAQLAEDTYDRAKGIIINDGTTAIIKAG